VGTQVKFLQSRFKALKMQAADSETNFLAEKDKTRVLESQVALLKKQLKFVETIAENKENTNLAERVT